MEKDSPIGIGHILKNDSHLLRPLVSQLIQLKKWNAWLIAALPDEKNILQHCQIVRYENNILYVLTDSPHWVMKFRFHVPQLITQLKTHADFSELQDIQCRAMPITASLPRTVG